MIWQVPDVQLVAGFARSLGCDWIGWVRVDPHASCDADQCHINVDNFVASHGGTPVLGYYILESAWTYQAVLHSVWCSPSGELVDITPAAGRREVNVFARLRDGQPQIHTRNVYSRVFERYDAADHDLYHVYALVDPRDGLPFHIGFGEGARSRSHIWETSDTDRVRQMDAIRAAGFEPRIEYLAESIPDLAMATGMVSDLAMKYGRRGREPHGILAAG